MRSLRSRKGEANILLIIVLTGFAAMLIFLYAASLFMSHVNQLLYTIKVDMFNINRSAIIALNKEAMNENLNSIDRDDYYNYFKKVLQYNYGMDNNLEAGIRFIEKIDILEYEYYQTGQVDSVTGKTVTEPTIHTQIGVKVKPIVFRSILKDIFYFKVHQDIKVRKIKH